LFAQRERFLAGNSFRSWFQRRYVCMYVCMHACMYDQGDQLILWKSRPIHFM
jgi:hypothetical protein